MPVRRYEPVVIVPRTSKYETRHDYGIDDSITRADYLSNAVLEDTYEAANRSRGKDHALLRDMSAAIAEAPWHLRARGGSVPPPDYRNVRATSLPPRPRKAQPVYKPPEPLPTSRMWAHRPVALRYDVMRNARARSLEPVRRQSRYEEELAQMIPTAQLWAHRPVPLRKDASRLAKARAQERQSYPGALGRAGSVPLNLERASDYYFTIPDVQERALNRYLYAHRGRFGPESKPPRPTLGNFPQVYVPWKGPGPSNRSKEAVYHSPASTGAVHASRPPLPKPTERKAIRDVDGFTKPKNLLSWQYRVESRLNPDDVIYEPASFIRMREQVRDVQEKMDRQRQLLDRYLDSDFKPAPNPSENMGGSSAGGDPDNRPVSDLRRKLRRTLARSKNNPDYYRE